MRRFAIVAALLMGACSKDTGLTQRFANAACVPSQGDGWNVERTVNGGHTIRISGYRRRPSIISVASSPGRTYKAEHPGDYVYPDEVRIDEDTAILYVKYSGLAVGLWSEKQTWLFEYALSPERLLTKQQVEPADLPAECR